MPALTKEFGYSSVMEVPRLEKIVVNIGLGEALQNPRALDAATADIATITGQKPVANRAKRSIANFKVRAGQPHRPERHRSRRPHVGVLRPPGQRRPAAHPRLPRRLRRRRSTAAATTAWACGSS